MARVPLALACHHAWVASGGGGVTMNVQGDVNRVKIDSVRGWRSLPEVDDQKQAVRGSVGEVGYPVATLGKTLTYEGRLQGRSPGGLEDLQMSMERAFSERSQLGVMIVDPQVADYGSGDSWNFTARVMQLDCDEEQTLGPEAARSPWQRPFVLSLRMLDPRFYKEPIRTLGSGTGTRTLTNDGNAPSDPSFTVATTGAVTITNNTVDGRKLRFIGVPSGDLVVDFKGRTATIDGDDAIPYLQSDSDWWDEGVPGLKPGDNSINVSGGQAWSASWYDASW